MTLGQRIEASTEVTSDKCTFTWTVKNYRLIKFKVGEVLESPKFSIGSDNKKYFNLELYPAGNSEKDAGFISLFLTPVIDIENEPDKLVCKWTVSLVKDKKVIEKFTGHYDFADDDFNSRGWPKFYKVTKIDELISSDNTLSIQCELEILDEIQTVLNSDIVCSKDETVYTIKFDFSFLSEKLSDVKFIVEDKEIPAHKIVLSAFSPVFRTKFISDVLENEENFVKITDTTANVVTEMLQFIYTGQINAIDTDMLIELLGVADKYQIDGLKIKCGKILYANLSSENAVDILLASHKYKVEHLEDEAIKFVTNHTQLLSNSNKMKKIDDPDIWMNLTQSILKTRKNVSCLVCHPENHS